MKFRAIFLILIISLSFVLLHTEQAFSQQANTCQSHTTCVHPDDILKYSVTVGDANSTQTYNFVDMIDSSHIRIVEQNQINNNEIQNNTLILNLKTGFTYNEQDINTVKPFLEMLPSPIVYEKSNTSVTPVVTDFNGFKRTALVAFHAGENSTSRMEYDIETGILLDAHSISIVIIGDKPVLVDFSNELTDTNIINSNSIGIEAPKNVIIIPSWVKNTSKWWSQDQIQDSEFIKAIQYLISIGVMQVPHGSAGTSSSQQIPTWIKKDAGWWSGGQISDDEFVKGIQWLISNGMIKV
jgi:hypothetical protein